MPSSLTPTSFCCGTTAVQDDAAPGTQEYIMLRQDSIHSADIRSKGSPFRAKCHEIFCCPLKQAVHKESSEPEGLSATPLFLSFSFFSFADALPLRNPSHSPCFSRRSHIPPEPIVHRPAHPTLKKSFLSCLSLFSASAPLFKHENASDPNVGFLLVTTAGHLSRTSLHLCIASVGE